MHVPFDTNLSTLCPFGHGLFEKNLFSPASLADFLEIISTIQISEFFVKYAESLLKTPYVGLTFLPSLIA